MPDIESIVAAAFAGNDSAPETPAITMSDTPPAETPAPASSPETPALPAGNDPQGTPSTDDEVDFKAGVQEYLAQNPELAPLAEQIEKGMRTAYLQKTQALAEQRKSLEATHPDVKQFSSQLDTLYRADPTGQLAANWLAQITAPLHRQQAPAAPAYAGNPAYAPAAQDPTADPQEARLRALEANLHREQLARYEQQIGQEFDELQTRYGREIPLPERQQVTQWALQQGYPSAKAAWVALNADRIADAKAEKARAEASKIVQQKLAAAPAPAPAPNRSAPAPELPKDLDSLVKAIYRKASGS